MRGKTGRCALVMGAAGLAIAPAASAEVYGSLWVEVDNSVATIGDAAGMPTGLEGIRTFDLFVLVSHDVEVLVSDFGFAASRSPERPMWTTQAVYQNPLGGDTQSAFTGALRVTDFAALEFDTYVGLGQIEATIVQNANIFSVDWSPEKFFGAWYVTPASYTTINPATPDADGKVFLARVSVHSSTEYGDYSDTGEYLGGTFFISARDDNGEYGMHIAQSGVFPTRNAFEGPTRMYSPSVGFERPPSGDDDSPSTSGGGDTVGGDDSEGGWWVDERFNGDLNYDGAVDALDMQLLLEAFGTLNPRYDFNGDLLIEDIDVGILRYLIEGTIPEPPTYASERERRKAERKAERAYNKLMKKAEKQVLKAEKERRRAEKRELRRLKKLLREQERQGGGN